jgi:dTDP-4-amino-4,6-dideoxygalactose transaminase
MVTLYLQRHLQRVFESLGYSKDDFPVSEEVSGKIFSLPMRLYLKEKTQGKVLKGLSIVG